MAENLNVGEMVLGENDQNDETTESLQYRKLHGFNTRKTSRNMP